MDCVFRHESNRPDDYVWLYGLSDHRGYGGVSNDVTGMKTFHARYFDVTGALTAD
jgi:hypothetical protein